MVQQQLVVTVVLERLPLFPVRQLLTPVVEAEGPVHLVPHAISILAPLFDEAAALALGRALEGTLGVAGDRPALDQRLPAMRRQVES